MASHQVELVTLAPTLRECPADPIPEIAFSGRSNVGKSSLLNLLVGRKRLAHTSAAPGKTQTLVYYKVDERWHLVDMPGYGYARVPTEVRRRWTAAVSEYLHGREQLAGLIQLVDIRVGFTPDDRSRLHELVALDKPFCLAMTKADKVPRARQEEIVAGHLAGLSLAPDTGVILTSALHHYGQRELWAWIGQVLAGRIGRPLVLSPARTEAVQPAEPRPTPARQPHPGRAPGRPPGKRFAQRVPAPRPAGRAKASPARSGTQRSTSGGGKASPIHPGPQRLRAAYGKGSPGRSGPPRSRTADGRGSPSRPGPPGPKAAYGKGSPGRPGPRGPKAAYGKGSPGRSGPPRSGRARSKGSKRSR
jgi:GTP-binding protein